MYVPDESNAGRPTPPAELPGPARYAYLVSRLRHRQITMEEATELFGIMQGMLRESQATRAKVERTASPPPTSAAVTAAPRPSGSGPPVSDDLLLLGLLALGTSAGLGAAFAKKFAEGPSGPATPASSNRKARPP